MTIQRQPATLVHDVAAAFGLLTRLPVRVDTDRATARGAAGAWAYPLVGGAMGLAVAGVAAGSVWLDLPALAAGILGVAAGAMLTGALHEDGLADCADGLWGGWTRARRLEIMKDSRIGAYGVIALVLALSLKAVLIAALAESGAALAGLVAAGAVSRAAMVAVWAALPPARADGLSRMIGQPGRGVALAAVAMAAGLAAAGLSEAAVGAVGIAADLAAVGLAAGLAALAIARTAHTRLGGQTGDVLGATQQVSELAALCALVAIMTD